MRSRGIWIPITERDHSDPFQSSGAIAMEHYLGARGGDDGLVSVANRLSSVGSLYGNSAAGMVCYLIDGQRAIRAVEEPRIGTPTDAELIAWADANREIAREALMDAYYVQMIGGRHV